ncbi:MAG: Lrp/AsnC ligand binding domain-containing protein [Thaumarchaeota archaeon]|nr:Lrp/AsnC ligand binding domain-containing protein [Nitrososphaerota archaeon]MCL5318189.1 Lrp/AsnC ligand binding domain-containing protein [Nitrososphaerota archaeon]
MKAREVDDLHNIVTQKIGGIDGVNRSETFIELKAQQKAFTAKTPARYRSRTQDTHPSANSVIRCCC